METWHKYDEAERGPDSAARLLAMEDAERAAKLAAERLGGTV